MGFKIREIPSESKFPRELSLDALAGVVPPEVIGETLREFGVREKRERKLNMVVVIFALLAMNIFTRRSIGKVMEKLSQGLRYLWPDPEYPVAKASALGYRRNQLAAQPVVALFHRICTPLATSGTKGAFLFGYRSMALDGTIEDVPDTRANAAVFGRYRSDRGESAFPQVKGVYLLECGTHAIVDAGFWPSYTNERWCAKRLVRSVSEGMLVMMDRGLYDFDLFAGIRENGAHVLARVPANICLEPQKRLADGSVIVHLRPSDYRRRKSGEHLSARLVEYTITDPQVPGYGKRHRIITTVLDPELAPAREVAQGYHERWEIENTIDEIDTHQRLAERTLRSLTPVGVIQELYMLLIAHYAVRALMHKAAVDAGLDPDRLSFTHALAKVKDAVVEFAITAAEDRPKLEQRLTRDIARGLLPERRARTNPRVLKRKIKKFPLKRPRHASPGKLAGPIRESIELLPEQHERQKNPDIRKSECLI